MFQFSLCADVELRMHEGLDATAPEFVAGDLAGAQGMYGYF